jgi:hypothetical protein
MNLKGKCNSDALTLSINDLYVNTQLAEILNQDVHDLLHVDSD